MTAVTSNPLRKYFREPGLSITLPSHGYFYPAGMVEFGMTGELEVYPMTAYDELILKNPDGLLNGDAVAKVIRSCVPGVHDATQMCMPDVNTLMLAIRAASYGDDMAIDAACPACGHQNSFGTSIRYLIETATEYQPEYRIEVGDGVAVLMRPHSYAVATRTSVATFEQVKVIQNLKQQNLSEEAKNEIFDAAFQKLCENNLSLLAEAVLAVIIPDGYVEDREHILEYVRNIDARKADLLQAVLSEINEIGVAKDLPAQCQKCDHAWKTRLTFDPAHFFG
jgi:hypothetical protein